jgi:hypothetical protein
MKSVPFIASSYATTNAGWAPPQGADPSSQPPLPSACPRQTCHPTTYAAGCTIRAQGPCKTPQGAGVRELQRGSDSGSQLTPRACSQHFPVPIMCLSPAPMPRPAHSLLVGKTFQSAHQEWHEATPSRMAPPKGRVISCAASTSGAIASLCNRRSAIGRRSLDERSLPARASGPVWRRRRPGCLVMCQTRHPSRRRGNNAACTSDRSAPPGPFSVER